MTRTSDGRDDKDAGEKDEVEMARCPGGSLVDESEEARVARG